MPVNPEVAARAHLVDRLRGSASLLVREGHHVDLGNLRIDLRQAANEVEDFGKLKTKESAAFHERLRTALDDFAHDFFRREGHFEPRTQFIYSEDSDLSLASFTAVFGCTGLKISMEVKTERGAKSDV